jgi:hypothetical protein
VRLSTTRGGDARPAAAPAQVGTCKASVGGSGIAATFMAMESTLILIGVLAAWFALQFWVLPRMGVPT